MLTVSDTVSTYVYYTAVCGQRYIIQKTEITHSDINFCIFSTLNYSIWSYCHIGAFLNFVISLDSHFVLPVIAVTHFTIYRQLSIKSLSEWKHFHTYKPMN